MNAIGYCRVSTEEQALSGISLEAQEDKIRLYCKTMDWSLIKVVKDEKSGKDLNRPGIQYILGNISRKANREFDAVVVFKLDRLTRSVKDIGYLMEIFDKNNIAFVSIQESVDTSTASGRLFYNIVVSISQWEREVISERTKSALSYKKSMGQRVGQIPYGFSFDSRSKSLVPLEDEQKILKMMVEMRSMGFSYEKIANELNRRKILTKEGKKRWFPYTVRSVLVHWRQRT